MKLSTITWIAALIVMTYYLTTLSQAIFMAHYAYYDARNSQIVRLMEEVK